MDRGEQRDHGRTEDLERTHVIRMYGRLLDLDPLHCLRLFGDNPDALFADDDSLAFVQPANCQ
jgi:hypothetical protein